MLNYNFVLFFLVSCQQHSFVLSIIRPCCCTLFSQLLFFPGLVYYRILLSALNWWVAQMSLTKFYFQLEILLYYCVFPTMRGVSKSRLTFQPLLRSVSPLSASRNLNPLSKEAMKNLLFIEKKKLTELQLCTSFLNRKVCLKCRGLLKDVCLFAPKKS